MKITIVEYDPNWPAMFEQEKQLAMKDWRDSNDYADAKTDFIRKFEKEAAQERQNK